MCATFRLSPDRDQEEIVEKLKQRYSADVAEKYRNTDIYPKSDAPVMGNGGKVALLRWGFPIGGSSRVLFNARAETLGERAAYRDCLSNRCLVPFSAFYEWGIAEEGGKKQKYAIRPAEVGPYYLAALWKPYAGTEGKRVFCFVIITTQPNREIAAIHSRMPAIIRAKDCEAWLSPTYDAAGLLASFEGKMEIIPA